MYDVLPGLNSDSASLVNKVGTLAVGRRSHVCSMRETNRAQGTEMGDRTGLGSECYVKKYALAAGREASHE
jgi:hypothetical protein